MFFTCLLQRDNDGKWRKSETVDAHTASDAAERYCDMLARSGDDRWEGFEDQVPVLVRVIDPENQHTDFEVTPNVEFSFSAEAREDA